MVMGARPAFGDVEGAEVSAKKLCAAKIRAVEVGAAQIGFEQNGVAEIGEAQVAVGEVESENFLTSLLPHCLFLAPQVDEHFGGWLASDEGLPFEAKVPMEERTRSIEKPTSHH